MRIEDIIFEFAEEKNILAGITGSEELFGLREQFGRFTPFVKADLSKRLSPKNYFPDAKSIIVVAVPYGKKNAFENDGELRGKLALGYEGLDYHIRVKGILNELMDRITKITKINMINTSEKVDYKIFADAAGLPEKELAKKAGLGFQGKNSLLITEKFGSYVFLGYAILNVALEISKPIPSKEDRCMSCDICQKACPLNALKSDFQLDVKKCVSFITQNKENIPEDYEKNLPDFLYGCDICQKVCPFNKEKYTDEIRDINSIMPKLEDFIFAENKEFKERYKSSAILWKGRRILKRNAINILKNKNTEEAKILLQKYESEGKS